MLQRINDRIRYRKEQKRYLKKLKPWNGDHWKRKDDELKSIKKHIKTLLINFQNNRCAYCGLPLSETSNIEIEHIAPKGKRPQFTFTPYNLALACRFCNGFEKKGTKETITTLKNNYKLCDFNIVHPYFDNPRDHFNWVPKGRHILISHKTTKGKKSIEIFKLDSTPHNEARARLALYEDIEIGDKEMEDRLTSILTYKMR
ncbi:HNH endonuclease [Cytobacillus firmus]|uniref:HNH endonuclease n=1 Tax=Cytobacillus firmus TaxID=1399 RepID=UPI002161B1E3|nr:HNH endonuclease [Cytobacillus firmus]MCS0674488.1 HNH endonuclease [Cytobacillus firmus]